MDAGIAALIGAALGFTGSGVIPWIQSTVESRTTTETERRVLLRAALRELSDKFTQLSVPRADSELDYVDAGSDCNDAIYTVGLLLNRSEASIELLARKVLSTLQQSSGPPEWLGVGAREAFAIVVAKWFRGQLSPNQIEAAYEEELRQLRN